METTNYQQLEEREFEFTDFLLSHLMELYEVAEFFIKISRKKREKYMSLIYELYSELERKDGVATEEDLMKEVREFFSKKNLAFDMKLLMLVLVEGQLGKIVRIVELRNTIFAELQGLIEGIRRELLQVGRDSEDFNTLNEEKALVEGCMIRIGKGSLYTIMDTIDSSEIIRYTVCDKDRELGAFEKFYVKYVYQNNERYGDINLVKAKLAELFRVTEGQIQKVAEEEDFYSLFGIEQDGGLAEYVIRESFKK